MSHLLQMRGLKLKAAIKGFNECLVASFTDAWIETAFSLLSLSLHMSHLLQMRGLKQHIGNIGSTAKSVASFTDAWIETAVYLKGYEVILSHLLQMRGLKQRYDYQQIIVKCRIFYRCVD